LRAHDSVDDRVSVCAGQLVGAGDNDGSLVYGPGALSRGGRWSSRLLRLFRPSSPQFVG
jgi:hypothetical protein